MLDMSSMQYYSVTKLEWAIHGTYNRNKGCVSLNELCRMLSYDDDP